MYTISISFYNNTIRGGPDDKEIQYEVEIL